MVKALIDGDILLYRACNAVQTRLYILLDSMGEPVLCSSRKKDLEPHMDEGYELEHMIAVDEDSFEEAVMIYDTMLNSILMRCETDDYEVYITGNSNYRKRIYPEYKAHRPDKPVLYSAMVGYLSSLFNHYMIHGQEADDALGINQRDNTIICSIDKDLLMVEGKHYNFVTGEFRTITKEEGMRNFYKQLLTGDRTDNIPGLRGIGPKKAEKILDGLTTEEEMFEAVLKAYDDDIETLTRNGQLLWIRREENQLWTPTT